jgi:HAMP domain-containing protein
MSVADAMAMVAGRVGAAVLLLALIMSDAVVLLVAWRRVNAQ